MADNRGWSPGAVGLAVVIGGLAGAAMALLLAPQSGRESREQLRGYARRAEENIHELAETATQVLDQTVDKGRDFIKDKKAVLTDAVKAGRAASQQAGEKKT